MKDNNIKKSSTDNSLVYGRNTLLEILKTEKIPEVIYIISQGHTGSLLKIVSIAKEKKIRIKEVSKEKLDEMAESEYHQGVVAILPIIEYIDIKDLVKKSKDNNKEPFIIITDQIEDPHNLGAIIRTAEAAGVDGVIIPKHGSAPINSTVFKTSAGALAHIDICKVTNIANTIEYLKTENIWVFGADMDGEVAWETNLSGPIAIVIGAEGKGLRPLVKERCDGVVSLPMLGKIQSLNVSVASGVLMYEIVKQRKGKKGKMNENR